jgi:hypothetical protein
MELGPVYKVTITKIKTATGNAMLDIDTSEFSDEVIHALIGKGLEAVINARMAKVGPVTKLTGKDLADAHKKAMEIATENLDDLKSGKVKHSRGKSKSTIPAAVRAEAMRLAKTDVKDAVRALGYKPSHYNDKAYTAKAKEYIENDPYYIEQATQNIEARKTPSHPITLNISDLGPAVAKKSKPKADELPAGVVTAQKPTFQPHARH